MNFKPKLIAILIVFLIASPLVFSIYVDPSVSSILDKNRYIDPNDPLNGKLIPGKYIDPNYSTPFFPLSTLNGVKPNQGDINIYSSNKSIQIIPDYIHSKINLIANISSTGTDNNKVAVSASDTNPNYLFSKLQAGNGISLLIQNPGGDENVLITATGSGTDTNCSNNPNCILTGRLNSNFDANVLDLNADDIRSNGTISAEDFNQSILDHNDSFSCPSGQAIQTIGNTTGCIPVGTGTSGRTYTSGTPATIEVNNDLNTISQNFDGNFSIRFRVAFDTNFIRSFDTNFTRAFDTNFAKSFDSNFQRSFDGNFTTHINALDLNNSLNYLKNSSDGNGSILGTTNQVNVTNGLSRLFKDSNVVLSLPQNIDTSASPQFIGLTLSPCSTFQVDASPQIRFKVDCAGNLVTSTNIVPVQVGVNDIGNSTNVWDDGWFNDLNVRNDTNTNNLTANKARIRNLSVDDLNASCDDLNDDCLTVADGNALYLKLNSSLQTLNLNTPNSTGNGLDVNYVIRPSITNVTNFGTAARRYQTIFANTFNANPGTGGPSMLVSGNTAVFTVNLTDTSMDFNTGTRSINFSDNNIMFFGWGMSGAAMGISYQIPVASDPTWGDAIFRDGSYYNKTVGTGVIPMIAFEGIFNEVGARLVGDINIGRDANVTRDLNVHQNLKVDGNIFGQVFGAVAIVPNSCTTICDGFDGNAGNWTCVAATSQAGIPSTCSDTLIAKNCMCRN